jgi:transcriptional regulator with XRE-family HTH domain
MIEWKPLVGHEGDYEVSNIGVVRRVSSRGKFHQRFTQEEIEDIKACYVKEKSQRKVASLFGVTQMTISKIVRGMAYVDSHHVLATALRRDGYLFVTLSVNGKHTHKAIHTAVAEAFLSGRPHGAWINHKDGDKFNNRVSNLEYMSPAGNSKHAIYELGRVRKLTFGQAKDIWYAKQKGEKRKDVAARHDVSIHMVTAIWMGKSWWHAR